MHSKHTYLLILLCTVLPSESLYPNPEADFTDPKTMLYQTGFIGNTFYGRLPIYVARRRAIKSEFPFAVLLVLSPGPDLTAVLVSRMWVIAAMYPGFLRRRRPATLGAKMGRAYAGFAWGEDMEVNGKIGEDIRCPTSPDGDHIQCRLIVEVIPQNSIDDPANILILAKVNQRFTFNLGVGSIGLPNTHDIPAYHREQCTAIWFKGSPRFDSGEDFPAESQGRRRKRLKPQHRIYDLWMKPLGLWSVRHCHDFTEKMFIACGDDRTDENIYYGTDNSDQAFWVPDEETNDIYGGGGPTMCPSVGPTSAIVKCQGVIGAVKIPVRSAFDVLINDGSFAPYEVKCNYEAKALRRSYIWIGAMTDWIKTITSHDCKDDLPVYQAMSKPKKVFPNVKITPKLTAKDSAAVGWAPFPSKSLIAFLTIIVYLLFRVG